MVALTWRREPKCPAVVDPFGRRDYFRRSAVAFRIMCNGATCAGLA
jgi:hypothetical protein